MRVKVKFTVKMPRVRVFHNSNRRLDCLMRVPSTSVTPLVFTRGDALAIPILPDSTEIMTLFGPCEVESVDLLRVLTGVYPPPPP